MDVCILVNHIPVIIKLGLYYISGNTIILHLLGNFNDWEAESVLTLLNASAARFVATRLLAQRYV